MSQIVTATFADGVLKPDVDLGLAPQSRVRLIVQSLDVTVDQDAAWNELDRFCEEHPVGSGGRKLTRDALHERR